MPQPKTDEGTPTVLEGSWREPVDVVQRTGRVVRFELVRVVDVESDAELAAEAREGTLNTPAHGAPLAEPFGYHLRSERRFIWVIPPGAQHRFVDATERLRAAAEPARLPAYVRVPEIVHGVDGLAAALGEETPPPRPSQAPDETEARLAARVAALEAQLGDAVDQLQRAREEPSFRETATSRNPGMVVGASGETLEIADGEAIAVVGEDDEVVTGVAIANGDVPEGAWVSADDLRATPAPGDVIEVEEVGEYVDPATLEEVVEDDDEADDDEAAPVELVRQSDRPPAPVNLVRKSDRPPAPVDLVRRSSHPPEPVDLVRKSEHPPPLPESQFEPVHTGDVVALPEGPTSEPPSGAVTIDADDLEIIEELSDPRAADLSLVDRPSGEFETIEDLDELEAVDAVDTVDAEEVTDDADEPIPLVAADDIEEVLDGEALEALVDDAELVELEEVSEVDDAGNRHRTDAPPALHAAAPIAGTLPAGVSPPADFVEDPRPLRAGLFQNEVWFFAKAPNPGAFQGFDIDVLVQYLVVDGRPVALFTLVERSDARPRALRLAFDPTSAGPERLLANLGQRYRVRIAVYDSPSSVDEAPRRLLMVDAAREPNAALVLATAGSHIVPEGAPDITTATSRALAAPPPAHHRHHPFRERAPVESARLAHRDVAQLARWCTPRRLDEARLSLSVPDRLIDESIEATLRDALRFGIPLPDALLGRVVEFGLAESEADFVAAQLEAFEAVTRERGRGGLSAPEARRGWQALEARAARLELPLSDTVRAAMTKAGVTPRPDELRVSGDLGGATDATLIAALADADARVDACIELLTRDPAKHGPAALRAVRDMPREDIPAVLPLLLDQGEALVDPLRTMLRAKKSFVRQTAAFVLGEVGADDAAPDVVAWLGREKGAVWEEAARAMGLLGEAAVRAIASAVREQALAPERAALALAHVAREGYETPVEALRYDPNEHVARAARGAAEQTETAAQHHREASGAEATKGPRAFGRVLHRAITQRQLG